MPFNARTDLAVEARESYMENSQEGAVCDGVKVEEEDFSGLKVTRVRIENEKGEMALGKGVGNYITMEIPPSVPLMEEDYENACRILATELKSILPKIEKGGVLVLGLGNRNITADAIGPKTVDSVLITRHLIEYMPEEIDQRLNPVCAISPGVLGITGVETGEIVKGVIDRVKPSLVIAIDALCSRRMERVNRTVQISDTGIVPGAGIGNRRMAIDKKTLGIPVIAIGVPTVVDAATIAGDTIDRITESLKNAAEGDSPLLKVLKLIDNEDKYEVIKEVLKPDLDDFIVTPKEVDTAVDFIGRIIANGINIALHEGITLHDIDRYK